MDKISFEAEFLLKLHILVTEDFFVANKPEPAGEIHILWNLIWLYIVCQSISSCVSYQEKVKPLIDQ